MNFVIPLGMETYKFDFSGNMNYYIALLNHTEQMNAIGMRYGFIDYENVDAINDNLGIDGLIHDHHSIAGQGFESILNIDIESRDMMSGSSIFSLGDDFVFPTPMIRQEGVDIDYEMVDSNLLTFALYNEEPRSFYTMGAFSTGIRYTMPHSPDLKLSMEIEMDGIDTITTSGGSSISNIKYTGNPLWQNYRYYYDNDIPIQSSMIKTNPFSVYDNADGSFNPKASGAVRNGRKSWRLKFSYLNDRDLFSSNLKGGHYSEHSLDETASDHYHEDDLEDGDLYHNIYTDDSFYAQVWNKTLGGALPFIFQPDSNFRDEFYICKFDQDSLKVSQSAYKVYDISVKIVEVW